MTDKISELVELIYAAIPNSDQICNLVIADDCVRFEWWRTTYRVNERRFVEICENSLLKSDDKTMLIEALLNNAYARKIEREM